MISAEVLEHGSPEWDGPPIRELGFGHISAILREQGDSWEATAQSMLVKAIVELEATGRHISPENGLEVPVPRGSFRNSVVDQGAGPRKVILGWFTHAHEKHIDGRTVADSIVEFSLNTPFLRPHISGITAEAAISFCWAYVAPEAAAEFIDSSERVREEYKLVAYNVLQSFAARRGRKLGATEAPFPSET